MNGRRWSCPCGGTWRSTKDGFIRCDRCGDFLRMSVCHRRQCRGRFRHGRLNHWLGWVRA